MVGGDGDAAGENESGAAGDADAESDSDVLSSGEREELLERVRRKGATIGVQIPETVDVGDEELQLAEFVIETRRVPGVPPEAEETLAAAKRALREEREAKLERLESAPLEPGAAEALADEVVGIDRALNALENLRGHTFGEAAGEERLRDYERWLGFLDRLGR